ncbi:uncharacterized protein LOC116345906 [Contarinia nasturtii]|uniref:uncharacterized protein LOC116345906 n=1 Tax=Contarinia nasturtii TaxID=265458 RepID=UPI0012D37290|nr:uncharacterized protein LOC116345906 [Contarinia nasturtii]
MKFPRRLSLKLATFERVSYHCLRLLGILIGIAAIVYFMYDTKSHGVNSQTRLIKRELFILVIYGSWIIGIILENPVFMLCVLYILVVALAFFILELLYALIQMCYLWIHYRDTSAQLYDSLAAFSLASVFCLIIFLVHYFIYKFIKKSIEKQERKNEEKSLLNKGKNVGVNDGTKCNIFPCCV